MASAAAATTAVRLVILYGTGGLSDVGRHAILAALKEPTVEHITVITSYPQLLDETNWKCSCPGGHTNPVKEFPNKITLVKVDNWKTAPPTDLEKHFVGAKAVISCLGHRQPAFSDGLEASSGNKHVIKAMLSAKVQRVVICSSSGIEEDWPPTEFHWAGSIMTCLFRTFSRPGFNDLTAMERAYKKESDRLDYLFVRPTGLGEEVVPVGEVYIQKEKGKDAVGLELAKMDCGAYMVQEALNPTRHRQGVVLGGKPPEPTKK